jgi:REP element-mobilizing transposase RayT
LFFLTLCTAKRRHVLNNPAAHEAFLSFCRLSPEKAAVWVGRYVLMPDHIHVFVSAEGSSRLSRWVGSLKMFLSKTWRRAGDQGPFWQEGFFDHVMRSGESYAAKWCYVAQNPVRAGLAAREDAWPFAGEIEVLRWD